MSIFVCIPKFELGDVRITRGAQHELPSDEVLEALTRHVAGDWGELDDEDRRQNDAALEHGFRLLSRYSTISRTVFWIITEHDRSATTILLPNEY